IMKPVAVNSVGATDWSETMHRAVSVPASQDLRPFLKVLKASHLAHHVTEESGTLVIWAADSGQAEIIAAAWQHWLNGTLNVPDSNESGGRRDAESAASLLPVKSMLQAFLGALW